MSFTRSRQPVTTDYKLLDSSLKQLCHQKDLGIVVTKDLKWTKQVEEITSKASSMLGFIRRTASDMHNILVRKFLYLSLVRSKLGYASQVWAPQTVTDILSIERVQRHATKFILSLPYRTATTYRERLLVIGILPVCYWNEFLDLVFLYKSILSNDVNVSIRTTTRTTRNANPVNGILLNISRCRTVSYKNNYLYVRAPSVWNILPSNIRDTSRPLAYFKNSLFNYYLNLLEQIYNSDNSRTFKSVCVKCHSTRSLDSLIVRTCC